MGAMSCSTYCDVVEFGSFEKIWTATRFKSDLASKILVLDTFKFGPRRVAKVTSPPNCVFEINFNLAAALSSTCPQILMAVR